MHFFFPKSQALRMMAVSLPPRAAVMARGLTVTHTMCEHSLFTLTELEDTERYQSDAAVQTKNRDCPARFSNFRKN